MGIQSIVTTQYLATVKKYHKVLRIKITANKMVYGTKWMLISQAHDSRKLVRHRTRRRHIAVDLGTHCNEERGSAVPLRVEWQATNKTLLLRAQGSLHNGRNQCKISATKTALPRWQKKNKTCFGAIWRNPWGNSPRIMCALWSYTYILGFIQIHSGLGELLIILTIHNAERGMAFDVKHAFIHTTYVGNLIKNQ